MVEGVDRDGDRGATLREVDDILEVTDMLGSGAQEAALLMATEGKLLSL